jgi:hypothetical protein
VQTRRTIFALPLAICFAWCGVARAAEPERVDPFLQAAQWAEEAAAESGEAEAIDLGDNGELVACGDEVGMAGLIEPDRRQRHRWTVLAELPVLLPSYSTSTISTANEHPILGPRTSLGWESDQGFGIRGRFWGFDSAVDMDNSYAPPRQSFYYYNSLNISNHQINFSGGKFDLDFFKRVELRRGHFLFGASITSAQLKLEETLTVTESTYYNSYFYYGNSIVEDTVSFVYQYDADSMIRNRATGLGLLAEGSHRFYETPFHSWSIFGRGRIAYLIGQWEQPDSSALTEGDGNMAIGEGALGLEYRRKFENVDLLVQCSFEVQSWDVSQVGRVNFAGVTPAVGLSW